MGGGSGEDVADHLAGDVGEAEVAAGVAVGEAFVVEAEAVEHGGVEVVDGGAIDRGAEAEVVGGAVGLAAADAAACEPDAEAPVVVVAAQFGFSFGAQFDGGGASEFAAPEDEGVLEEAALFEVGHEGGDGAVDLGGVAADVGFDVVVVIPGLAGAVPELDHADAAFEEASGDEGLAAVDVVAVHLADVGWFAGDVEGVGGLQLHAEGQFEGFEAGFEAGVAEAGALVFEVQFAEEVELAALDGGVGVGAADVLDQFVDLTELGVDEGPLEDAGQEAGLPVLGILDGHAAGAHGDEAGEVLVFGAETVEDPGAEAGAGLDAVAAVHEHEGRLVVGDLGDHGPDDGDVVGMGGGLVEQFADFEAAAAAGVEGEGGGEGDAGFAFGAEVFGGERFAGVAGEGGFGVEGVDVGGAAVEEEVDDAFGFGGEVGWAGDEGGG